MENPGNVEGSRILITGCSSGIGEALAEELALRGGVVIATSRDPDALHRLDVAQRLQLDVTSPESVETTVAVAGDIDILINNAGLGLWGPVEAVEIAVAQSLFDTNVFGAMRMTQAVLPAMRARGRGLIVQISSAAGRNTSPLVGYYSASKHALEAASEALRVETMPFGVRVCCMSLGAVTSSLGDNRRNFDNPDYAKVTEHFRNRLTARRSEPTSAADAASAIANAIADGGARFRYDVTADSRRIVEERRALSDEAYHEALLEGLDLPSSRRQSWP